MQSQLKKSDLPSKSEGKTRKLRNRGHIDTPKYKKTGEQSHDSL